MKKEVLFAIIAGLVLGLIITMGIYTANRSINQQRAKKQLQAAPTPSVVPANNHNKTLNLTSHEPYDLLDQRALILSGVAWPGAVVAFISESDSQIVSADSEGIFSFTADLIKGFNELTLIAADDAGTSQTQNLILTYSTNKIEPLSSGPALTAPVYAAEEATPGPETVTDKIKERLQDTANEGLVAIKEALTEKSRAPRKKAYIGSVSALDKTSLTLTFKDQVFVVNLTPDTIFVKGAGQTIDFDDLELNDFIIAMGWYQPEPDTFDALRVSVINDPEPPANKQLITGKISEVDGQKISFNSKSITLTGKTKLIVNGLDKATTEDLALGDSLFALVTLDSNGDFGSVNNVFVLPGKNNPVGLTPTNIEATGSPQATDSAADEAD